MSSKLTILSFVFALLALAVAAWSLTQQDGVPRDAVGPSDQAARIQELERQVEQLTQTVEELRGLTPEPPAADIVPDPGMRFGTMDTRSELRAMVDEAVEKKARSVTEKLKSKENKRPPIEEFASVLELSSAQQASVEQEVIRGQREAYAILETPTADGRNLFDELVELTAASIASPGKDPGWGKWYTQVVTEKVPGTDQTYAARIEVVKTAMRGNFRRVLSKEQSAEFAGWGVDPLEIRGVPGSPGVELERRILERARALGAKLPEDEED